MFWIWLEFELPLNSVLKEKNHKTIYDEIGKTFIATGWWFEVYKNCLVYIK